MTPETIEDNQVYKIVRDHLFPVTKRNYETNLCEYYSFSGTDEENVLLAGFFCYEINNSSVGVGMDLYHRGKIYSVVPYIPPGRRTSFMIVNTLDAVPFRIDYEDMVEGKLYQHHAWSVGPREDTSVIPAELLGKQIPVTDLVCNTPTQALFHSGAHFVVENGSILFKSNDRSCLVDSVKINMNNQELHTVIFAFLRGLIAGKEYLR